MRISARWTRTAVAAGLTIFGISAVIGVISAFLAVLNLGTPTPALLSVGAKGLEVAFPLAALAFPAVGALIVARHPQNRIGWLYLALGLTAEITFLCQEYGLYAVITAPGALPGGALALFSVNWSWSVPGALLALPPGLFPRGDLPSSRWRFVYWLTAVALALSVVAGLGLPREDLGTVVIGNPLGLDLPAEIDSFLNVVGTLLWSAALIGGLAALIMRYRGARGSLRQQIKWFLYGTAVCTSILVISSVFYGSGNTDFLSGAATLSVLGIPLATGIAIFRYRLYDIDLLINRTVVYAGTSAAIALTFFVAILGLEAILSPLTSGSELAVAASTLVSFALFQPVRRRVQDAVDRRFDRSRYDAARTLDAFADRLRDEVDLDTLRVDLLGAVHQTIAPAHASLWLREPGR